MTPTVPLLELRQIRKSFGMAEVLKGVDFQLAPGEVVGFLGANGAGKSTLMRILAGILRPDSGHMAINGKVHAPSGPVQGRDAGISIVHQELSLVDTLSIVDNLFLAREIHRFGQIRQSEQIQQALHILARLGSDLDPKRKVAQLRTGEKQIVEIARALLHESRVLILDEPTAALSPGEAENLFRIVGELSAQGIGVVYISHRLEEIERLADRVVVLRDGRMVYDEPRGVHNRGAIISAMAGRDVGEHVQRVSSAKPGAAQLFETKNLGRNPLIHGVNLALRPGELVALTGLVGSGRTELLRLLAGIDQPTRGEIFYEEKPFHPEGPAQSMRRGIAFLPEDRKDQGLFLAHSAQTNLSISVLEELSGGLGLLRHVRPRDEVKLFGDKADLLGLHPKNPSLAAGRFSGGNQQKILLGRILATRPRLLLLDEPTRGVDASARQDIYRILADAAARGTAVLFATSEFAEALTLGQRIVVMREGTIAADFPNAPDLSPNDIMRYAVSEQS